MMMKLKDFTKCLEMKFDEVEKILSQLEGLINSDKEEGSILYTPSPYGWSSDDTYEFVFIDDICVSIEVDSYEED
jgi:hypothetical protein